jgi:hypothetical protein
MFFPRGSQTARKIAYWEMIMGSQNMGMQDHNHISSINWITTEHVSMHYVTLLPTNNGK